MHQELSARLFQMLDNERRNLARLYVRLALLIPTCLLVILAVVASYSRGAWLGLTVAALMLSLRLSTQSARGASSLIAAALLKAQP